MGALKNCHYVKLNTIFLELPFFITADNKWYRAVVLEVCENETVVIYADYGNTEKVPFSRILPIPMHLLQLPFQITRCTLTGEEMWLSFLFSSISGLTTSGLYNCSELRSLS